MRACICVCLSVCVHGCVYACAHLCASERLLACASIYMHTNLNAEISQVQNATQLADQRTLWRSFHQTALPLPSWNQVTCTYRPQLLPRESVGSASLRDAEIKSFLWRTPKTLTREKSPRKQHPQSHTPQMSSRSTHVPPHARPCALPQICSTVGRNPLTLRFALTLLFHSA